MLLRQWVLLVLYATFRIAVFTITDLEPAGNKSMMGTEHQATEN